MLILSRSMTHEVKKISAYNKRKQKVIGSFCVGFVYIKYKAGRYGLPQ